MNRVLNSMYNIFIPWMLTIFRMKDDEYSLWRTYKIVIFRKLTWWPHFQTPTSQVLLEVKFEVHEILHQLEAGSRYPGLKLIDAAAISKTKAAAAAISKTKSAAAAISRTKAAAAISRTILLTAWGWEQISMLLLLLLRQNPPNSLRMGTDIQDSSCCCC